MSEVKRYISTYTLPSAGDWTTSCASYTYILATDHDAKVAALELAIADWKAGARAEANRVDELKRERDTLAAELAALKGAAGTGRLPDEIFVDEFYAWWESHGQYVRSGGGDYERTFAFEAWRHLYPRIVAAMARDAASAIELLDMLREMINCTAENDDLKCGSWISTQHPTIQRIDAFLAAHRAGKEKPEQPPANCRQRLMAEGKPYPRSKCAICGRFAPKSDECGAALAGEEGKV